MNKTVYYQNRTKSTIFLEEPIYPNPAHENLTISLNDNYENAIIEIRDLNGRILYTTKPDDAIFYIDIKDLNPGVYFVNIVSPSETITEKIIVQ